MEKIGAPIKAIEYRVRVNSLLSNTSQNISASAKNDEEPKIESERVRVKDAINRTENSFNSCNEVS
jgi:hypothetical protein